jgi:polyvinyl alcohol dehydrogenase (cytochrome)
MMRLGWLWLCSAALWAQAPCAPSELAGEWNGWGRNAANTRHQTEAALTPENVGRLALKWAFGLPQARSVFGQPAVVGGRVYVGSDTGEVFALNASAGCLHWTFRADAGVRTAVSVAPVGNGRRAAFFGDVRGKVYAVDAHSGVELWKTTVETHPAAKLTGAPVFFEGRLYVPVSSKEEGLGGGANYACCTFRGSVVALEAASGREIWKTYVIQDEPRPTGAKPNGVPTMGPSGAAIWSPPTIDAERRALYVATGDAYSEPADKATDAVLALDLDSGAIRWIAQDTENDVWIAACMGAQKPAHCGPDHDFGSPPMLVNAGGRDLLVIGQKSGNVWAHDPDTGAVVWRTPLVANTTEFGGKIVWGGSADAEQAYFGLGPGGIGAVRLRDGERQWFTGIPPAPGMERQVGHDGPLTTVPGLVFSGGWDGVLRALSAWDGRVLWSFNTARQFPAVNGVPARGGSMGAPGPVVAGDMLFVVSGYVGVRQGAAGNLLLAFGLE